MIRTKNEIKNNDDDDDEDDDDDDKCVRCIKILYPIPRQREFTLALT